MWLVRGSSVCLGVVIDNHTSNNDDADMREKRDVLAETDHELWNHDWPQLLDLASERAGPLAERLYDRLDSAQKKQLLNTLLVFLWRIYRDEDGQKARFEAGQSLGMHVLPVHFYSPLPDTSNLNDVHWQPRETVGIDWREDAQLDLLERLSHWSDEMQEWPVTKTGDVKAFHLSNQTFDYTDAAVLYAILREFGVRRIIEVGSGWSSLVISQACRRQEIEFVQIEPHPPTLLTDNSYVKVSRRFTMPVQDVELDLFSQLEAGDVLFIDSTHVSKIGSDVNHLMFNVIPRLAPGVLVHFHDILLPNEYPKDWVREKRYFWNEQYLIHAFLMFNQTFDVLLSNAYLFHHCRDRLDDAFSFLPRQNGGSLWFRRST